MSEKELDIVKIVGLNLIGTSEKRLLDYLTARIIKGKKTFVVTPNPEFIVFARHNPWFKLILDKADVAIPDGIGLVWAGKILKQPIKERISGTDLMEKLCQEAAKKGWKVYLLGGKLGVAKKTLAVLKKRYSGLRGWAEAGPKLNLSPITYHLSPKQEIRKIVRRINLRKSDFLFIALGMGKQEKFIYDNWDKLDVKLAMGVGGAFDYVSGKAPRAPKWVQKMGLEWLFRLVHEPWRWKRQLRVIEFAWLVFREKIDRR